MPEASSSCPPDRRPDRQTARTVQTARTAACAGLPPKAVFSKKVKEAAPVLRACARCTVRRDCERIVAPADNWFDGVCGGRLYRSGRPVEIPAHLLPAALTTRPTLRDLPTLADLTDLTDLPTLRDLPTLPDRPALPGTRAPRGAARGGSLA